MVSSGLFKKKVEIQKELELDVENRSQSVRDRDNISGGVVRD